LLEEGKPDDYYSLTSGFSINDTGVYNLLVRSQDSQELKYLKVSINLESCIIYVVIEEQKPEETSLKIRNDCEDIDLYVYQNGVPNTKGFVIKAKETIPFAWDLVNRKTEIYVDFSTGDIKNYHSSDNKFNWESLQDIIESVIPVNKNDSIKVHSSVLIEGNSRILRFYKPKSKSNKKESLFTETQRTGKEIFNLNVGLEINNLGISLISQIKKHNQLKRTEILYIYFKGIKFKMLDSNQNRIFQARIKYMNIDNNTSNESAFPVILTPSKPKALLSTETNAYFLDVLVHQKPFVKDVILFRFK